MQFLENAYNLEVYTIRQCLKFPKRYTFFITTEMARLASSWAVQTVTYPAWSDIEDGTVIEVDTIVTYNGKTWQCTEQHIKSTVYKPKAGSSKWSEYTE